MFKDNRFVKWVYFTLYADIIRAYRSEMRGLENALKVFLTSQELSDGRLVSELKKDIKQSYWRTFASPQEYFLLGFRSMPMKERSSFVTDRFLWRNLWKPRLGGGTFVIDERDLLDKFAFCQRMTPFMHRGFVEVQRESDYKDFLSLAIKVKDIFCKPNFNCMGKGIFAAHIETEDEAKIHFKTMIDNGGRWIVEEAIKQSSEMASWNPTSVNTIRYYSFMDNKGNYNVLPHVIRTGRRGSVVDNGGSGGVFAVINPKTGLVYTDGIDETGRYYQKHPDSGVKYKGWQVPRWQELCEAVELAHKNYLPNHHYVGWDWALTDQGWTLIEANWGQFLLQFVEKKGRKAEFLNFIGKK